MRVIMTTITMAIGSAAFLPHDVHLDIDDRHPLSHGGLQLELDVNDGTIAAANPRIGFMHRSAEKLFESRDYRQIMMLANRHDWLNAFHGELVIALALEEALGLTPPPRATWTRLLLAEMNRISTHMLFLSFVTGVDLRALREPLLTFQQQVSGSRIHPMINRIGGLAHGLKPDEVVTATQLLADVATHLDAVGEDLEHSNVRGLGIVTPDVVKEWNISGVTAMAAGIARDIRFDQPYLTYGELTHLAPSLTETTGDALARYRCLVEQIRASSAMVGAAAEQLHALSDSDIHVPLPKVVRLPQSQTYVHIESPLGSTGALVVSAGDKTPWRLKLNTPSFHLMQALKVILPGNLIDNCDQILMSLPLVIGDVDR
jgi:NADH-quinone oxidoreductase subunit D